MGCKRIKSTLDETYGPANAYSLGSVKYWIREWKEGRVDAHDAERVGRPLSDLADAIAGFLEAEPFASTKSMAKAFHVSKETIKRNLIECLGFKKYSSKWIPYFLSPEQKEKRVIKAQELLDILLEVQDRGFENIMTGDESWFRMQYFHSCQWAADRADVPRRIRPDISTKKRMVSIFFTGIACVLVDVLPSGTRFNADYFCNMILSKVSNNGRKGSKQKTFKKMMLHMDDCRVHNSKKTEHKLKEMKLRRAPHPAYSPDISPMDFWFFGFSKGKLAGQSFEHELDLENAIRAIAEGVTKSELFEVFLSWIKCLNHVIESGGEYYIE
jgi:hypothetical protein